MKTKSKSHCPKDLTLISKQPLGFQSGFSLRFNKNPDTVIKTQNPTQTLNTNVQDLNSQTLNLQTENSKTSNNQTSQPFIPTLVKFGARWYNPTVYEWLTFDPSELNSGTFNWYAFVGGDVVNFVDVWG